MTTYQANDLTFQNANPEFIASLREDNEHVPKDNGAHLFRYYDALGVYVTLEWYEIKRTTKCGFWIDGLDGKEKFVLDCKDGYGKRYAYIRKIDALRSYLRRRDHFIVHLRNRLSEAQNNVEIAKKMIETSDWLGYATVYEHEKERRGIRNAVHHIS